MPSPKPPPCLRKALVQPLEDARRTLPAADRTRLDAMLRRSDDNAASHYWALGGRTAIVDRSVARLGLTDTDRPPAGYEDYWGYVSLSAADTVRIYRYLLDTAEAPVRPPSSAA